MVLDLYGTLRTDGKFQRLVKPGAVAYFRDQGGKVPVFSPHLSKLGFTYK